MAKQKFLTSLILTIFLGMPICVLAERPVSGSAAAQGETEETTTPNLFGYPASAMCLNPMLWPCGPSWEHRGLLSSDRGLSLG